MADKIIAALNLTGQISINFTAYLSAVRTAMMSKSHKEQLRFCFNLLDHDENGHICPNDMDVFNTQYTGTCALLNTDYMALANMYSFKKTHTQDEGAGSTISYVHHLTKLPPNKTNRSKSPTKLYTPLRPNQSASPSPAAKKYNQQHDSRVEASRCGSR